MTDSSIPIAKPPQTQEEKGRESTSRSGKDSASRITRIAQLHGLDARLQSSSPQNSALERAIQREKQQKEQRQRNLEQIIHLAFKSCKDEMAGEPDKDWLVRYFDMAQNIHNGSMQRLWAQVLKREVITPGSTSIKALKVLQDMTPREAQILQRAASLACSFGHEHHYRIITGLKIQSSLFSLGKRQSSNGLNMGSFQLPYSSILVLTDLGLLHASELESGQIEADPALIINYQGKILSLQVNGKGVRLVYYRFTPTGNELCKLLGNKPDTTYYDQLVAVLGQKFSIFTEGSPGSVNLSI